MPPDPLALLDAVQEALCHVDAGYRFTYVNSECAAYFGASPSGIVGRSMWDLFPFAYDTPIGHAIRQACEDGQPRHIEALSHTFGRWLDVRLYPDEQGLLIHFQDIHDRKVTEIRANRLQAVTEALAGALTLGEVTEVVLEAAMPAAGAEAGAVLLRTEDGTRLELIGQQGYPAEVASTLEHVPLDANTPGTRALRTGEAQYLDGAEFARQYPHLAWQASPGTIAVHAALPFTAGRVSFGAWLLALPPGTVLTDGERAFIETLTHLNALALARAKLHGDLERTVERRTAKLQELNMEMRAYADTVSRDLTPSLRRIRGFADLLSKRLHANLRPDEARFFEHIQSEGERMSRLIADLGTFVASGQDALRLTNVPLAQLASEVRADLAPLLRQRHVVWSFQDLPTVRGDALLLRQVFAALFANAVKFTRARDVATIEVGARRGTHEWTVWVRDNGAGLDPAQAHTLFHPLAPARAGTADHLGLANVRRVITRHGGRVWAEGEPNVGATFYFTLPDEAAGAMSTGTSAREA